MADERMEAGPPRHDWKKPWIDAAKVLNIVAAHTATAVVIAGVLSVGDVCLKRLNVDETKWLAGTAHQFDASDLFHAADLGIILLFVLFGIYHGFKELR